MTVALVLCVAGPASATGVFSWGGIHDPAPGLAVGAHAATGSILLEAPPPAATDVQTAPAPSPDLLLGFGSPIPIPEPASAALVGFGLTGLWAAGRRVWHEAG